MSVKMSCFTLCLLPILVAILDPDGNRAPSSDILQKVSMPIMSKDNCNQRWANKISDSMLCAYRQGVGACQVSAGGGMGNGVGGSCEG